MNNNSRNNQKKSNNRYRNNKRNNKYQKKKTEITKLYDDDKKLTETKEIEYEVTYDDDCELENDKDIEIEEVVYDNDDELEQEKEEDIEIEEKIDESETSEFYEPEEESTDLTIKDKSKFKLINKIMNIIFIVITVLLIFVAIDVICVSKYNKGPFFAIPLHTYKDGGTKEYYGLGYKVIKYHQKQGRRDKVLGSWKLKYNSEPVTVEDLDLAIAFSENEEYTNAKYYKQFVRIISTLNKVDTKNKKIIMGYKDEDGKYTLNIECKMVKEEKDLKKFKTGKEITIIGTVTEYKSKTKKQPNTLYVDNCFAEQ